MTFYRDSPDSLLLLANESPSLSPNSSLEYLNPTNADLAFLLYTTSTVGKMMEYDVRR